MRIKIVVVILLYFLTSCTNQTVSILFIGSSLTQMNGGLDANFTNFTEGVLFHPTIQAEQHTQSLVTLGVLWNKKHIQKAIKSRDYDYIVIQSMVSKSGKKSFKRTYIYLWNSVKIIMSHR